MAGNADQYGSDISQYDTPTEDGTLTDIAQGTPVVKSVYKTAEDIYGVVAGDDRMASAAGLAGDIYTLGLDAMLAVRDPVYALVNAGLTIVLELVDPLQEMLHAVSGDPDEMQVQIDVWGQVAEALTALKDETAEAVNSHLTAWTGQAADAAFNQLGGLEASAYAAAHEVEGVQQLLEWSKLLAETIEAVIRSIIAELVSWLIMRGLLALASSAFTFGASVATFLLSAAYKSYSMFSRAFRKFSEASRLFRMLYGFLGKFLLDNPVILRGAGGFLDFLKAIGAKAGLSIATVGGLGAVLQGKDIGKNAAMDALMPNESGISRGSGGQLAVDPDELVATAGALDGLAGNTDSIQSVAQQATSADMTWGLPGMIFASKYTDTGQGLTEVIGDLSAAQTGTATSLRQCADDYSAADGDIAGEFGNLQGQLDGK